MSLLASNASEPGGSRSTIGTLDGLRALAVGLVLIEHLPSELLWGPLARLERAVPTGYLGVDLFFVLSGFLITRILLVDRREGLPVRWFLARRALRIFPAFYLMLTLSWLAWDSEAIPWLQVATYTLNLLSPTGHGAAFLHHTWSLAVEEHFYLLWPLFITFAPRRLWRPMTFVMFPLLAVGSSIYLLYGIGGPQAAAWVTVGTQSRMLTLLIGAGLALGEAKWRAGGRLVDACAWLGAVGGIVCIREMYAVGGPSLTLGRYLGSAVACTGAVVLAIRADGRTGLGPLALTSRLLNARPLPHFGRISYGIYLYHNPIIFFVGFQALKRGQTLQSWHAALAVLLTLVAAEISFWLYERPFLRLKRHFTRKAPAKPGVPGTSVPERSDR